MELKRLILEAEVGEGQEGNGNQKSHREGWGGGGFGSLILEAGVREGSEGGLIQELNLRS